MFPLANETSWPLHKLAQSTWHSLVGQWLEVTWNTTSRALVTLICCVPQIVTDEHISKLSLLRPMWRFKCPKLSYKPSSERRWKSYSGTCLHSKSNLCFVSLAYEWPSLLYSSSSGVTWYWRRVSTSNSVIWVSEPDKRLWNPTLWRKKEYSAFSMYWIQINCVLCNWIVSEEQGTLFKIVSFN